MKNADGKEVTVTRRIYVRGDIYKNRRTGNLWTLAFILPEGYVMELASPNQHTCPLTSEELDAEFEFYMEAGSEPITLYL